MKIKDTSAKAATHPREARNAGSLWVSSAPLARFPAYRTVIALFSYSLK
jgi:hypothetical protein